MMAAQRAEDLPRRSHRTATVLAVGGSILLGRLLLPWGAGLPLVLATLTGALLVVSMTPALPQGRPASVPISLTLAIGLAAIGLAWTLAAQAVRPAPGSASVVLSTLAAVAEEAFFRRFLYARLEAAGGIALAVVGSALAFALVHLPAYGLAAMPVDLGAGLVLSWQRCASGRWEVPAATHVAANLLAGLR
jgi:membrane protease YdiL (CAAX protease family)